MKSWACRGIANTQVLLPSHEAPSPHPSLRRGEGDEFSFSPSVKLRSRETLGPSPTQDRVVTPNLLPIPAVYSSPEGPYIPGTGMSFNRR